MPQGPGCSNHLVGGEALNRQHTEQVGSKSRGANEAVNE